MEDLTAKPGSAANWKGPYLQPGQVNDPWQHPYQFRAEPNSPKGYVVTSLGNDKAEGGEGYAKDITTND